ncbi:DUF3592 domain-containing protein [Spirosoma sp. BT702]|uniref:DUF3592 domain-containing protein n=1 Tax=Spirosoma profusum TaxID=2771354 RepID=A0A926XYD2_9BACT|nr:DUF3592 domain-containing protein [Spirosoma profusum]MBD2703089.1 DUF3592 domain-containing protein [Spirosoma profusum]
MGYLITFTIGVILLLLSFYLFSNANNLIQTGNRTNAVVEELIEERSKKGKSTYRPIFRFTTITGKEIHYSYGIASSPPDWKVGETATIVYRTDDPENPLVLTYFGAFGWAVILLAVAAVLLIIGGGNYVFNLYAKQFLV